MMESYPNGDPEGPVETFDFEKLSDDEYATIGSESGRNEYWLTSDNSLVHKETVDVTCTLDNGEFQWSHGYRSRIIETTE